MDPATRPILLLLTLLLFPGRLPAQASVPPAEPYAATAAGLERLLRHEVETKEIPAISIALVDDQRIVWAQGFGAAQLKVRVPATADTVHRVGSVSKLFTDIAVMQLVERGQLDLDAPVRKYLSDFRPKNNTDKPLTLRQLMAHRSGLVREPPVGHYFDPTGPSLKRTVESLNRTELVYPPEDRIKYSNAAIAAVGLVLEEAEGKPFVRAVQQRVLQPLGMTRSGFEATPELNRHLADAVMWTYDGRTFPAPTFPLGMAPAGSMYSSATDLSKFLSALFAGGRGTGGPILKPETLEAMWRPQFAKEGEKKGFGLGFYVDELDGRRRISHGGAVYGFATELAALPGDKLGVVVVASRDCANAVTRRLAEVALRSMLAARQGKPLPDLAPTGPVPRELARRLVGRYERNSRAIDLEESAGRLFLWPARGGLRADLRASGDGLLVDGLLDHGTRLRPDGDALLVGTDRWTRGKPPEPKPLPERWAGLIGEYGWDHNVLYILEKEGRLCALIEWFFLYPLEEVSENVYRFPDWGLYDGEQVVFTRDKDGRAISAEAAGIAFERRPSDGDGKTFRIRPQKPVDELRRTALAAKPPVEKGEFRKPDLVELTALEPGIRLDVRYATTDNFLGAPVYTSAKAFLQKPAAEALVRAHKQLATSGYGLLVHDGYRPWYVTKIFWDATPESLRTFVADPTKGSRHNRGCAVDLTLYDLKTGKPVTMVSGYDEFSDRSYADYPGGTSAQRRVRGLLRAAMEANGFTVYGAEWWHFDYQDWQKYPILNATFEELGKGR